MHTGKYEKLRFRNICRVCEAAGWAAECPGPRSSPTTAEWRVMRILFPSVSRHSPSSTPTFFILASHHTNSYGHKIEREGKMTERAVHRLPRLAVFDFRHLPATHDWQSRWHNSPSPSCSSLLSLPTLNQHPCQHCQLLAHTDAHTLTPWRTSYWVNLLVIPGQTIHQIGELEGRWGNSVIPSARSFWTL